MFCTSEIKARETEWEPILRSVANVIFQLLGCLGTLRPPGCHSSDLQMACKSLHNLRADLKILKPWDAILEDRLFIQGSCIKNMDINETATHADAASSCPWGTDSTSIRAMIYLLRGRSKRTIHSSYFWALLQSANLSCCVSFAQYFNEIWTILDCFVHWW